MYFVFTKQGFPFSGNINLFFQKNSLLPIDWLTISSGFYFLVTKLIHVGKIVLNTETNQADAKLNTKTKHNYLTFHIAIR